MSAKTVSPVFGLFFLFLGSVFPLFLAMSATLPQEAQQKRLSSFRPHFLVVEGTEGVRDVWHVAIVVQAFVREHDHGSHRGC